MTSPGKVLESSYRVCSFALVQSGMLNVGAGASRTSPGTTMTADDSYEIFRKELDNTTELVEAVKGFEQAQKRVSELNEGGLGEHFLFDPFRLAVVEPSKPEVPKDPFAP
jgi:hypothetical protein